MNTVIACTAAQELVMPAIAEDNSSAVAFFRNHKMEFCIPVADEAEAVQLAIRFQTMIVETIKRYLDLESMTNGRPPLNPPSPSG